MKKTINNIFKILKKSYRQVIEIKGIISTYYWRLLLAEMGHEVMIYPGSSLSNVKNIKLGHHVFINSGAHLYTAGSKITIGNYVLIGPNCSIIAANRNIYDWKMPMYFNKNYENNPITIKDDVWIGENATILSGVTIHRGSVIGAGSVVTSDVPAYAIVGGVPAKVIKYRFDKKTIKLAEKVNLKLFENKIKGK